MGTNVLRGYDTTYTCVSSTMGYSVFISYRRKDQRVLANWLQDKLAGELESDAVFLDTKSVESGAIFPARLEKALESALAFIGLIGPHWNPTLAGSRRLNDPEDYVRREIALALGYAANDPRRLILPVLADGAEMPDAADLPECIRGFASLQAFALPTGDYGAAVRGVVERIVERLDELDPTPPEEKWVVQQIAHELSSLAPSRIAQIGHEMKHRFHEVSAAPESTRALARAAYRVGPPAFRYLLALGKPTYQMESLLELLATNWISSEEAAKVRRIFGEARQGKRVAIQCKYVPFTPDETLLKASGSETGWAWSTLTVKPSDGAEEIIQQIHEELVRKFEKSVHTHTTTEEPTLSDEERVRRERRVVLARLEKRRIEAGGERFPFVLHVTHRMAQHKKLLDIVQDEFPPLHILVATADAEVLSDRIGILADVVIPSDDDEKEERGYEAYANAHELIARRRGSGPNE